MKIKLTYVLGHNNARVCKLIDSFESTHAAIDYAISLGAVCASAIVEQQWP